MENSYNKMHTMTSIILNLILILIILSTSSPIILFGVFIFNIIIFKSSKNMNKFKKGFIYFIPFFIVGVIINSVFVSEGSTIIFTILNKNFTLEAMSYSFIFSFRLLLVIHIFINLEIMIDSDRALSYFSKKLPKTTLTMLIALKFFPAMKRRIYSLKEIYSIRGVDFEENRLIDKVKGYVPVISVLLESSLEGAFDIGEAAYIRGFLSGERSIYDKQVLQKSDYILIIKGIIIFAAFIIYKIFTKEEGDFLLGSILIFILIILLGVCTYVLNFRKEE